MATSSISGLASGLDTAGIIDQLMQLEAISQRKLVNRLNSEQSALTSLQSLNGTTASLATKAAALKDPSNWAPLKAKSSESSITVSAGSGAQQSAFSLTVDQVATRHRMQSTAAGALDGVVVTGGTTINLTVGGEVRELETDDGTLAGVVRALNASGTGVTATTVKLDDGTHKLLVQSIETGVAEQFTLTNSDGTDVFPGAVVTAAQDAAIRIEGNTVHSSTNTFTDVVPGLTISVSADSVGKTSQVSVENDGTAAASSVKALVDQLNSLVGTISSASSYSAATKTNGPLAGISSVRSLATDLQQSVYPASNTSMAPFGLQTDRYGKLVFDEAKFKEALAADPAAVAAAFTGPTGFAARVEHVAKTASDSTTGTLTSAITGRNSSISTLQKGIEAWDARLELRRTSLERQYTALEVALSSMNSQSTWLAGQISTLPSSNS
ncbi:flagellar hook-associated protein 2 [Nocardioides daedukensis]|uniref:Flagellar hook-associated protein 2 n=1 Tax=Nocardioides daedukensis TaxID=634462 RepID=A0A7Y9S200_9ACTN|nr:flagellar filament capping protein FliD [Nocardioides daedukensis]NYG58703.1 flagellar hook-associated protein 2 [Nocardioides daedukensis]